MVLTYLTKQGIQMIQKRSERGDVCQSPPAEAARALCGCQESCPLRMALPRPRSWFLFGDSPSQ